MRATIKNPSDAHIEELRKLLAKAYDDDPKYKGQYFVAMLVVNQYVEGMNVRDTIKNYFIVSDDESVECIVDIIKEG